MSIPRSVNEKIADWSQAYWAVSSELTPKAIRDVLATMEGVPSDPGGLSAAERLARLVAANDRTAALVAAMLTTYGGVKPAFVDLDENV